MPIGVSDSYLYGGLSGIDSDVIKFDFGHGVTFSKTFAHIFSTNMAAFSKPKMAGQHHPAPWKAVRGGYSADIVSQLEVPQSLRIMESFDAKDIIWLIAALFRLGKYPFLTVPVLSSSSFSLITELRDEPELTPFELAPRMVTFGAVESRVLNVEFLEWIATKWHSTAQLLVKHPKLNSALRAFDQAGIRAHPSSSLLAMWGAIEQLFAPDRSELRFRVSALLASFMEPIGKSRKDLYTDIKSLYNQRSIAAHSATEVEPLSVLRTHVLLRNALMKIIEAEEVPTGPQLEDFLFGVVETSDEWSLTRIERSET